MQTHTHNLTKACMTWLERNETCMINEALETLGIFDVSLSGTEGDTEMWSVQSAGVCFWFCFQMENNRKKHKALYPQHDQAPTT